MCYCYGLLAAVACAGVAVRTIATIMLWRFHSAPINARPENMLFGKAREQQTCDVSCMRSSRLGHGGALYAASFPLSINPAPQVHVPPLVVARHVSTKLNAVNLARGLMVSEPCYLRLMYPNFTYGACSCYPLSEGLDGCRSPPCAPSWSRRLLEYLASLRIVLASTRTLRLCSG